MALSFESGKLVFTAKPADFLPVEGLRVYFPSGHHTQPEKAAYWIRLLLKNPVA